MEDQLQTEVPVDTQKFENTQKSNNIASKGEAVVNFFEQRKRMPTFAEMGKLFGYSSKNAVSKAVGQLVRNGYLIKDEDGYYVLAQSFKVMLDI